MITRQANDVKAEPQEIMTRIQQGEVLIYPTDTVYGIGCDATNTDAVAQVRKAKQRPEKPMSVIAPSLEWIQENFEIPEDAEPHLNELPGPYTYIFNEKTGCVADNVAPGKASLGVRRPDHWITDLVEQIGTPLVTTSANISGEPTITRVEEAPDYLCSRVDIAIDAGTIKGSASTIIDFTGDEPKRIR